MDKLKKVVLDTQIIDDFLTKLDEAARRYDSCELGLPLYDDGQRALLRETVYQFVANLEEVTQ
jgi:hypothetical protein